MIESSYKSSSDRGNYFMLLDLLYYSIHFISELKEFIYCIDADRNNAHEEALMGERVLSV